MLLEMRNITKRFGRLLANDEISLSIDKGEVLAVVGENGAGKSTLMKILYGLEKPTSGQIFINGNPVTIHNPQEAISHGIGMVQQHFMLFKPFTVAENIVYSKEPKKNHLFFDRVAAVKRVEDLSNEYGLGIDPKMKMEDCSVGLQQRVEILKVLYQNADVIVFDEPSAVLTPQEVQELLKTIRNLANMGKSIILITHKLGEVMEVADRILVMRHGKQVKDLVTKNTSIKEICLHMVGRQLVHRDIDRITPGKTVLDVVDVTMTGDDGKKILNGVNIKVHEGEIVGIAGVSGNGQSELIEAITGLATVDGGSIHINGNEVTNKTVEAIRNSGCACIPEDRYHWGCAAQADLVEVSIMAHHRKPFHSKKGVLKKKASREKTQSVLECYDVRYSNLDQKASELSGGNLQKLIVAREIEQRTSFLIAAEPTRGVDVGAMEFIHDRILEKRHEGHGILLISSELSEILTLSDRIYVIYNGKINKEFTREEADADEIGIYMMGGSIL